MAWSQPEKAPCQLNWLKRIWILRNCFDYFYQLPKKKDGTVEDERIFLIGIFHMLFCF